MAVANSISNNNGRGMEYLYVDLLCENLGFIPTNRTEIYQRRDHNKFIELPANLQQEYETGGKYFIEWIKNKFLSIETKDLFIDRLSDGDGVKGDVTDIRLLIGGNCVNISLKHNHTALKHQRPSNFPCQCGFSSNDKETITYKQEYARINNKFILDANDFLPENNLYSALKEKDSEYINKNLYLPMCNMVIDFLNTHVKEEKVNTLFRFLVGNLSFYKVISYNNKLVILEYSELPMPKTVVASIVKDSYVKLAFDNCWTINMRLHTASSRIGNNVSLKFDSQPESCEVPQKTFKY